MDISEVIKNIRSELNLSQEGLARELHMGFTSVNRWENHNKEYFRNILDNFLEDYKFNQRIFDKEQVQEDD